MSSSTEPALTAAAGAEQESQEQGNRDYKEALDKLAEDARKPPAKPTAHEPSIVEKGEEILPAHARKKLSIDALRTFRTQSV